MRRPDLLREAAAGSGCAPWRLVRRLAVPSLLLLLPSVAGAQDLERGKAVYDKYCSQCHGETGDGKGIAASRLRPEPRDFTAGKYKVRMTPTGQLPTDQDIRNAIRKGLGFPYTAMPPFDRGLIDDAELDDLVAYLKSFSSAFADPDAQRQPIDIPAPPPYTPAGAEAGREVYERTGCAACHGNVGRGDGFSAPTLRDDWGQPIRVADLTKPWTFRGGGRREDIFRTMSTGFAGTPMPGFHGALPPEDIWAITDYMLSLSGGPQEGDTVEAPYANVVRAVVVDQPIDLAAADELFAAAPPALFPLLGQIVEPGRDFYPSVVEVAVQAIYNQDEIAFRVSWHDMRAETTGHNAPDLPVPSWEEQLAETGGAAADEESGGDEDDFWGVGTEESGEEESADDFWGVEESGGEGDDFWGTGDEGGATTPDKEFSDAVAIQFPQAMPQGVVKPYFIFGDAQNPVDLWFADLGKVARDPAAAEITEADLWTGRGSAAMTPNDAGDVPEVVARYQEGEWSVVFKRKRRSRGGLSFNPSTFVPIAFSVWDGFNRERGNKRALSAWFDLYLEPFERPNPLPAMAKAFGGVLGLEILLIAFVRWRRRRTAPASADAARPATAYESS